MNIVEKNNTIANRAHSTWLTLESADFNTFRAQVEQSAKKSDWPLAAGIEKNIPIYDGDMVRDAAQSQDNQQALTAEWNAVFRTGPGVLVIKNAIANTTVIDEASALFESIIDSERADNSGGADHFAKPGANDRVWNLLQKHALANPTNFSQYYACAALSLASLAWLGPGYQVTAQLNVVNPGGEAQSAHRDYHLGFMTTERALEYPAICHEISPFMTLQGGVAHCDMPIESGPTKLLPFSQNFLHGYAVYPLAKYQEYFDENHVQLAMEKGDMLFFNPALMHAAGANKSADIRRMVNLFQISSAFGRALEQVDRVEMAKTIYGPLQALLESGKLSTEEAQYAVLACTEDYPFPTNLDTDPPFGGLVPKTHAKFMLEALGQGLSAKDFIAELEKMNGKRST